MSKSIILKGLYLKNFKGIKELDIDFAKVTSVYGDNGTGKTTVFDAFTWLLFDKDSQDKSKFDVQPLDENNNVVHMLETEVTAVLEIDGIKTALRKILEEKWVKPKGKPESELKGVTTSYYIDEVPKKQGEYKKAINDIIQEDIFKLLTNPMYFSTNLKWQDRKKVLMDIVGDFTDSDVIASKKDLLPLRELLGNKNIDELKKSIAASKKKLVKDKENIPARVDECNRSVRSDIDFELQEINKKNISANIKMLDEQILDSSKVDDEILKKRDKLYSLKDEIKNIEYEAKSNSEKPLLELKDNLYKSNSRKMQLGRELNTVESEIHYKEISVANLQVEMAELRKQYKDIQNEELHFDEDIFVCPTCKRPFEADDIETKKQEMLENFNSNQSKRLDQINVKGQAKAARVESLNKELEELNSKATDLNTQLSKVTAEVTELQKKIGDFKPQLNLESDAEYQELKNEISGIEAELNKPSDTSSIVEELKHKKANLGIELGGINNLIAFKEQNSALTARIAELQAKEKALAQQIADLEKQEFLCDDFIKTKVELLESSINSKFKYVKFRFFKQQVNGGIDEDCEPLVNGVPFNTNLNSAAKVNAGLDIINTLSQHYGINAPIFVDNKESVTKLIDTDSQLVNLVVSENDKKLRVESEEI
ncbi:AAA family ATPase [Clostridium hydrogenum]|uniref:AAA family ATPase n=1 Tax=Clostridium hydrogenum TaxID=2855764 RepID=UPI001F1E1D74|nr:AAA family ATPase [Clostridium hydrogenum]